MARPFLLQTRWVVGHVIVVMMVALMTALGFWQLDRLDERKARNEQLRHAMAAPALTALPSGNGPPGDTLAGRHVILAGTWDLAATTLVRYPLSPDGAPGYDVVTPLRVNGAAIAVNRGWIPVDVGKSMSATGVPGPAGEITVEGSYEKSQVVRGRPGVNEGSPALPTVTAIDEPWVRLTSADTALASTPLEPADLSEGPHFSYALQWFGFCVVVSVGWIILLRRSRPGASARSHAPRDERGPLR